MDLSEIGSLASIISLVTGLLFGFIGGRYSVNNKIRGKNVISDVDNRKGKIKQD